MVYTGGVHPESNFVFFSLKMWHLVAIILIIFVTTSWPNLDFYPSFPILNTLSIAIRSRIQWDTTYKIYKTLRYCKICAPLTILSLKSSQLNSILKEAPHRNRPNVSIGLYIFINVKKLQFIHTLTATDVHASKTAKIKKLYTMPLHIDVWRCAAA